MSGGNSDSALNDYATVCGGFANTASGMFSTVCGGDNNTAIGDYSFSAGQGARAIYEGNFIWADASAAFPYIADRINQFKIRAAGGVQMDISGSAGLNPAAVTINSTSANGVGILVNETSSDTAALFSNGGTGDIIKGFNAGGNTVFEVRNNGTVYVNNVALTSDRNAKENFTLLDARAVLAKVASLPLTEWNYKTESAAQKHVGPMAQDFYATFGLNGDDTKHISVVDESGVALAAIQGLNQMLQEQKAENIELKSRLENLEKLVGRLSSNGQK